MKDPKVGLWAWSVSIVAPTIIEKENIRWDPKIFLWRFVLDGNIWN
jgi:hypothetical protein